MTAGDLVEPAARRLRAAAVEDARREAQLLLQATAAVDARLHPDRPVSAQAAEAFSRAVARRAAREPYAYITGHREFAGVDLVVSPAVLIPRPETELLVERACALLGAGGVVCDLCTGSGAIALAVLARRPDAEVTGTDISGRALRVAAANARRLNLPLRLRRGDLWEALPPAERGRLDLCTCNPPYVEERDWRELQPEIRDWEPRLALVPAGGWRAFYARLCDGARASLRPGGWLLCEVGRGQAAGVAGLLAGAGWYAVRVVPDLAGIPRLVEGRWGA